MKYIVMGDTLTHHGIKGQEWGVRNGPPYPLAAESLSDKEKKKIKRIAKRFEKANKVKIHRSDLKKAKKEAEETQKAQDEVVDKFMDMRKGWAITDDESWNRFLEIERWRDQEFDKILKESEDKAFEIGKQLCDKYGYFVIKRVSEDNAKNYDKYHDLRKGSFYLVERPIK